MTYAHIFKCIKNKFKLMITTDQAISFGIISQTMHESKAEAKAAAKASGAKPHNY